DLQVSDPLEVLGANGGQPPFEIGLGSAIPDEGEGFGDALLALSDQVVTLGCEDDLLLQARIGDLLLKLAEVDVLRFDIEIDEPLWIALHLLEQLGKGWHALARVLLAAE